MEKEIVQNVKNPNDNDDGISFVHEVITENPDLISLLSADVGNPPVAAEDEIDDVNEEETASNNHCFTADSLDSIKSGESVFKLFTFDPKKCTSNVEKCVAFWKKIDEMDLKPVDCSLYIPEKRQSKASEHSTTTENCSEGKDTVEEISKEEVPSKKIDEIQISWCDALKELQKRKLDRVAKVAKPLGCKFCETLTFELEEEKDSGESRAEIIALNNWRPGRIKKVKKQILPQEEIKTAKQENIETTKIGESKPAKQGLAVKNEITKILEPKIDQKIKQPTKENEPYTEEGELEEQDLSIIDDIPSPETVEKQSCLSLMENVLKDVLAKMSEEIDVKQLVNEIITTATEKIKAKSSEQLKQQSEQVVNYKIPPYSFTGEYPCICESTCKCETVTEIEETQTATPERKRKIKESNKINAGTQWPEELQIVDEGVEVKGSYCVICGFIDCICQFIEKNAGNCDVVIHTCDALDSDGNQ